MKTFLSLFLVLFFLSGCGVMEQYYDRYGYPGSRHDRTTYDNGRHHPGSDRIRRDVRRYVDWLDRRLRLGSRQERGVRRLLEDRTFRHLRGHYRRAYPFPRSRSHARDFWRDADRAIERRLDRHQRSEYRYMTERYDRRRYDRRDRYDRHRRWDDDDRDDDRYRYERDDDDDDDDDD